MHNCQLTEDIVAASSPNPTVSRLELAARLRELRIQADKSIDDAAAELMCSVAKISRMETGGRGVQPRDIRDLCRLYGVSSDVQDELTRLAGDARKTGWWQRDFRTLDEPTTTLIGLETGATEVRIYDAMRVPGLLQTPEFTRAFIPALRPPGELTPQWINDTVAVRERRQQRVQSGELRLHAIVDEAALSRPVGGEDAPAIMRHQLERLIEDAGRPNVRIQVIPFDVGPHPGLEVSFQHMALSRIDAHVYVDGGFMGNFLVDKSEEVVHYRTIFDDLSARVALDEDTTVGWLRARLAALGSATQNNRRKRPSKLTQP
jgi:transcriptional regulator with XRE-family HTH domain